ncbi:hypothetical protein AA23498_2918 [Acetobacter nitrogenifigens DSM 23921 = NBRC 105050]|uniref:TIGR02300 family protein n=1 Tax=Acetobacter nitrogenifigens DSM 23921 = NBRC 105050 TaxID=1120919 RepID=A0A511XA90_9PROT|nr:MULTISPECIES: TIGR02300 family protein [Acetobacter]OUJ12555.1 hypothetical protein HK28_03265 [Acetobacter sp. DsW_063]GBQ97535.1 hypothetical protein AA23498_2918 [Acetobacter nitrogenifigens DSM 23921 = NBRC 105050]GEN59877.1 hypothetical protein ANI02nite_17610 [Acetobacter nitrogenifigens DSM 23921 = NBRC 105050]
MAQPELGTKRVCVSCGTRFYDLNASPAVCPKCGAEQPFEAPRLRRANDGVPSAPVKPIAKDDEAGDDIDLDTDDDAEDDGVIEDSEDLDDDADDIGNDIDVNPEQDEHDS